MPRSQNARSRPQRFLRAGHSSVRLEQHEHPAQKLRDPARKIAIGVVGLVLVRVGARSPMTSRSCDRAP